jgi:voltage-gated sodium channel
MTLRDITDAEAELEELDLGEARRFDDQADRCIAEHRNHRSRQSDDSPKPSRKRSGSPRGGTTQACAWQSNNLKDLLKRQLDFAVEALESQHRQALNLVDRYCGEHLMDSPVSQAPTSALQRDINHIVPDASKLRSVAFSVPNSQDIPSKLQSDEQAIQAANRRKSVKEAADIARGMSSDLEHPKQREAVFADAAAMKEKVKLAIMKPEYNVTNFYHTTGLMQYIARSTAFDNLTLFVIATNSIWIAIDTDHNKEDVLLDAEPIFLIFENLFCMYFCAELAIRFLAFKVKRNCLRDAWFLFDFSLVAMMVFETWIMNLVLLIAGAGSGVGLGDAAVLRLVKLLRLTRMARMARLLRAMPELMILIKGMVVAARSVFFTLCLLAIFLYIFGIAFTQLCEKTPLKDEYFPNVPGTMHTLLLDGIFADLASFVNDVGAESWVYAALLMIFILLTLLTVLNMLVGVLVEVVSVVSAVEKESMTVSFVKTKLLAMLETSGIDQDHNRKISKVEFDNLLINPPAAKIIQEIGVDVVGLVDFSDHIFEDGTRELSFPDFMDLVLQLRGCNTATVRDMVDLRKFLSQNFAFVERELGSVEERLKAKLQFPMWPPTPPQNNFVIQDTGSGREITSPVQKLVEGHATTDRRPLSNSRRPLSGLRPNKPFAYSKPNEQPLPAFPNKWLNSDTADIEDIPLKG